MFKKYEVTLNRIHDTVVVKEGADRLTLVVNGDAMRMFAGLNNEQKKLKELKDDSPDETVKNAAEYFAAVIFGKEQAAQLMAFYANDPYCVVTVCGRYFRERLSDKIAKAQKKMKV